MTRQSKTRIVTSFAIAISVVVGISAYLSIRQLVEANRSTTQTHVVLEKLDHLLAVLTDAETGQRGYILTGEARYLEPYLHATSLSQRDIDALRELTNDNREQQQSLTQLQSLARARLERLQNTIDVRDKLGFDAALANIRSGQGKQLMDQFRALMAAMRNREEMMLKTRGRVASASADRAMLIIAIWLPLLAMVAILLTRTGLARLSLTPDATPRPRLNTAARLLFAVVCVAIATGLCRWCERDFDTLSPFILFFPAVLIVASVAGSGPGLLATILSSLSAAYFFLEPRASIAVAVPSDLLALAIFNGTNVISCVLAERLQRSRSAGQIARQTEQRFRLMVDSVYQLAWTARADGFIDWYNQRWYEYTGTTPKDMEGWGWQNVHDPAVLQSVLQRWTASIATAAPFEMIFPLRGADGKFRSFLTRVRPRLDAQGKVVQWFGTNTDVEDLKRAEEASARLAAIVESSDDAIVSKRLDGTILTWNSAAERLFGYRAQDIIGTSILKLIPPERIDEEAEIVARLRRGEACEHLETVRVTRDGRRIDVSISISPLKDADGNVIGASKIARDITDRKRAQEAVAAAMHAAEKAKLVAEEASQTKDRFIAVLSHELRTPLNPVLVTCSILKDDLRLDADVREQLEMICRNVELETRLIDDLLDVTRIELGKVTLDRKPMELGPMLKRVTETCSPDIRAKRLDLIVDGPESEFWIDGDAARLQQVFWNVIKNAMKFTPEGSAVRVKTRLDETGFVLVQVIDSGIGIEPERLGRIFDAFEQGDITITKRFGGIGLGLAISKALVELHGGTIAVQSEGEGKGSTFNIRLPLASPQALREMQMPQHPNATAAVSPPAALTCGLRILLVEDHVDTANVMIRLLTKSGHQVDYASDVAMALKFLNEKDFDLLVSDLGLPDGNGWDLMRGLRQKGSTMRGIALSGFGQDADIQNSLDAGYNAHLTKPININVLLAKVREFADK